MITYENLVHAIMSSGMPTLTPIAHLCLSSSDSLVVCVGFEDRALASLKLAAECDSRGFNLVLVTYVPDVSENAKEDFVRHAELMDAETREIIYDRETPAGGGRKAVDALVHKDGLIFLDISGMSRLLIVQCVVELAKRGLLSRTQIFYTEAVFYSPSREEYERSARSLDDGNLLDLAMLVSVGVFGLTIVPELSSVSMAGCPMHVVVFPSWNAAQLAAVRSELQATYYSVYVPVSPDHSNAWRKDAIQNISRVDLLRPGVREIKDAPVLDVVDTIRSLVDLYARVSHCEKIVVAPTGSKVHAACVGIFRSMFADVQIVYPTPRTFARPKDYTRGVNSSYLLDMSFFADLVREDEPASEVEGYRT